MEHGYSEFTDHDERIKDAAEQLASAIAWDVHKGVEADGKKTTPKNLLEHYNEYAEDQAEDIGLRIQEMVRKFLKRKLK